MKKFVCILVVLSLFVFSCKQSTSDNNTDSDWDASTISTKNNSTDSGITQSSTVFSRQTTGTGIVGTWLRYTEATRTYQGALCTYHATEKTDYFMNDGTYKVVSKTQIPISTGYDGTETTTKGTYTLSIGTSGSFILTTTDNNGSSRFTFLVSDSYLSMTSF